MVRGLETQKLKIRELACLLRLHEQDLEQGNLLNHQKWLSKQFGRNYNGTLVIIRSNFCKEFGFYIPHHIKYNDYSLYKD